MADGSGFPVTRMRVVVLAKLDGALSNEVHDGLYVTATMMRRGRTSVTVFDAGRRPLKGTLYCRAEKVTLTWFYDGTAVT